MNAEYYFDNIQANDDTWNTWHPLSGSSWQLKLTSASEAPPLDKDPRALFKSFVIVVAVQFVP